MIPQEYSAAVTRALSEAFDVTAFEDIRVVTGGHTSSLVYRIVVRGEPYLLKIIPRKDDPSRHYASTAVRRRRRPRAARLVYQCRG